ncbi:cohesin loading factor-domain-containing protein [Exophiala viscosa]|uniref:cohesin loading factor-domain-containing protein n=1 Tax=Exophiala viscosa TaxID=2486360 RepID=UPI0021A1B984|nr:cohesin loading factor-domain-containing protein [Exophiala viscosa]
MDPNYSSYNPMYGNFPQSQQQLSSHSPQVPQQGHQYSQQPPYQQQYHSHSTAQSYQPQPYPQQLPQNYSQYYYNQDQTYQPQSQSQPQPQPFYPPNNTVQQAAPSLSRIQVVIPPQPRQSPSTHHQQQPPHQYQQQQRPQHSFQPPNQVHSPAQSFHGTQKQQHSQHPVPYRREPQPHSNVTVHIPSPAMAHDRPQKKREQTTPTSLLMTINPQMLQKTPQQNHARVLQAVEVNAKPKQVATKAPEHRHTPVQPDEPEPDYPSVLCVLADDYLDAARNQPALTEEYYTLVATALGCLESILNNFKLPPLREAQVSLRYARILYEETENYDEAETRLTKSIEFCERHKFIDLKYEMQLLLSKILYESKPKAALRDIQRMIDDIEAYRHTVWLYIFRLQHAMFSLASASPGEVHGATKQLEKITYLARQNSDSAVLAFAAVLEALLHLSSSSHEAVTATQTALAKARALQLNPDVETNPQLTILMEFIDLACSVQESNIAQTEAKRKIMHEVLYESVAHSGWRDDGFIYIPVSKRAIAGIQLQGHGHIIERNGKYFLTFSWLGKEQVEALGFLFSADSAVYKNGADGGKAEKFIEHGLSLVRSWGQPSLAAGYQQSHNADIFQELLEAQFLFLLCFVLCAKGLWKKAKETLDNIGRTSGQLTESFPLNMRYSLLYLKGVILQGTGNLQEALEVYQSPTLSLGAKQSSPSPAPGSAHQISTSYHADSDITHDFCILAAMNAVFIIQDPHHPQHNRVSQLLNSLSTAVQQSANKYIQAHYSLLASVLSTTTLTAKQYLKSAMEAAKAIGSAQTTALALVFMQEKLFKGLVDEQAIKCARAASHQVRRWGDPLWTQVVAGLEAETLEVNGMLKEAQQRKADAEAGWDKLPETVKRLQST